MRVEVQRSAIKGTISAPASKSAMQRLLAGALLADGTSVVNTSSFCDDSLAAIDIIRELGAEVRVEEQKVIVRGGFNPVSGVIFCGESGLSTRMFTPIAALHNREIVINGKGSVLKRPLKMVEQPLRDLGVQISSMEGYLPLRVKGPLGGGEITTDGSVSSQFITGLLMALPVAGKASRLVVENLVSRPYIDLTISILKEFGIEIANDGYQVFRIPGNQRYRPGNFQVEGDWSGAAFLMVMGAIAGQIEISGLDSASTQADKAIYSAMGLAGADVHKEGDKILINTVPLKGFDFDISDCPDLAPPLAALALACEGRTVLTGTKRLLSKESNRSNALEQTLSSLGARIRSYEDRIEIIGGHRLTGGTVSSFNDHRIAMTLAVAALLSEGPVIINEMESVNKSYPGFINDFGHLGGNIRII